MTANVPFIADTHRSGGRDHKGTRTAAACLVVPFLQHDGSVDDVSFAESAWRRVLHNLGHTHIRSKVQLFRMSE